MSNKPDLQLLGIHHAANRFWTRTIGTEFTDLRMYEPQGSCAFRDTCGKKSVFGGDLPCPYDGPPVDVRFRVFRRHEADAATLLSIYWFIPYLA
jgi:hypothetical protein